MTTREIPVGTVLDISPDELRSRRAQILAPLGTTYEDLLERAPLGALTGEERDVLDDLRDIAFLLGDD